MDLIKKQEKIAYYIDNNICRTYIVRKSYKPKTISLVSYGQSFNPGFFKMAVTAMYANLVDVCKITFNTFTPPSKSVTNCSLGPISRKSREVFGPEKRVVKLQSACFEQLIFKHAFNVRKTKRTAKFDGLDP